MGIVVSTAAVAATKLHALVREYGTDLLRMPNSVRVYMNQALSEFPEENAVLYEAYRRGVAEKVQQCPSEIPREEFLSRVSEHLASDANLHKDWARWAVNTWHGAVSQKKLLPIPGTNPYEDINSAAIGADDQQLKILQGGSPIWLRLIMVLIVASGAFLGGGIGRIWPLAVMLGGSEIVDAKFGKSEFEKRFAPKDDPNKPKGSARLVGYLLFFAIYFITGALPGSAGAILGWCFGRADGRPWLGFSAAFGSAFAVNTIMSFMACGFFIAMIVSFFSCFTASFKVASTTS
jgi:hypothetical protein